MVQKINPHTAPGCNRSPPTVYFQKMQLLGVFRPFLQRSLARAMYNKVFISLDGVNKTLVPHLNSRPKLCILYQCRKGLCGFKIIILLLLQNRTPISLIELIVHLALKISILA